MQAKALGVLVANTQKALEQSENQRKANEQIQRVENFVKDLTMDLNNMLAKFYFLKDHKNRKQEQMTDSQVKAVTEFAVFVKTLTKKVCSLLNRLGESRTFEEKIDKEIRELDAGIGQKLKEFDKALEETPDTLSIRLGKYANTMSEAIREFFTQRRFSTQNSKQLMHTKQPEEQPYNNKEKISAFVASPPDEELENLVNGLDISSAQKSNNKSKCYTYSKV